MICSRDVSTGPAGVYWPAQTEHGISVQRGTAPLSTGHAGTGLSSLALLTMPTIESEAAILSHLNHHGRFYLAFLGGLLVWGAAQPLSSSFRLILAGGVFFGVYLAAMVVFTARVTPDELRERARAEDEGIPFIVLITLAAICLSLVSILLIGME